MPHRVVCARCWQKIGLDNEPLQELVAAHDCPALMRHRYCPECMRWTAVDGAGRLVLHYRVVPPASRSEPCPGSFQPLLQPRPRRRVSDLRPQRA
jgi:hypothetical protein